MKPALRARRAAIERLEERRLLHSGPYGHEYVFVNDPLTWEAAANAASQYFAPPGYGAGHLAKLDSTAEREFVAELMSFTGQAWFGFTDAVVEGEWRWVPGGLAVWQDPDNFPNPLQTIATQWAAGEPDNYRPDGETGVGPQNYAALNAATGRWSSELGSSRFGYLIEFDPLPNRGPNGNLYEKVPLAAGVTWEGAQAAAAALTRPLGFRSGHLATVSDAAENAYLAAHFDEAPFWLGFKDDSAEGDWRWIDNTPGRWQDPAVYVDPLQTSFTNWAEGQPSRATEAHDYAIFGVDGRWRDDAGESTQYMIVEYDVINSTPNNIVLEPAQVSELAAPGTTVGVLTTSDLDQTTGHTYTLVNDAGGRFVIQGAELKVAEGAELNYESEPSLTVRVRTEDRTGRTFTRSLDVQVINFNEPPVITVPDNLLAQPGVPTWLSGVSVADPDVAGAFYGVIPLWLSLTADHGTLSTELMPGVAVVTGANGSSAMTLLGPLGKLNAAIDLLHFTADAGFSGQTAVTLNVDDLGNTGEGSPLVDQKTIVIQVRTPPVAQADAYEVGFGRTLRTESYRGAVLASQPLAYWRLDELGPQVDDLVGGYDGTISAATAMGVPGALAGDSNTAASFQDLDTRIMVDGAEAMTRPAGAFSVEAWVNPSASFSWQRIVSTRHGPSDGWGFALSNGRLAFTAFGRQDYFAEGALVPLFQWSHVAAVFDDSQDVSFYLNGQWIGTVEGDAPPDPGGSLLAIGDNPDQSAQPWQGKLDEVAFYGRALTLDEIGRHYQAGLVNNTVLSNDSGLNSTSLRATLVVQPLHGTLQFAPDGSFVYRPNAGFYGRDSFTYRAVDAYFESAPAEVFLDVIPVPGDADLDGDVDLADFGALKRHFGQSATRAQGDFNGDGRVDLADFGILKAAFGTVEPEEEV